MKTLREADGDNEKRRGKKRGRQLEGFFCDFQSRSLRLQ
jgi:hypothetical protein